MKSNIIIVLALLISIISVVNLKAQIDSTKHYRVYKFDIKEEIAPPVLHRTQKAFKEAEELNADFILLHLNTYGGLVDAADSIRTKIINSKIPVYVFIDNNAASAGALISIACDKIFMRRGATIGAATVVNQTGEVVPDKYQSYMRAMMRSTAEVKGRNPDIAEAMVDPSIHIEGVIDSGKVLTFTTTEAMSNGFCDGQAENIDEVISLLGVKSYEIVEQKLTATDKIIHFLINPMVSGLLIMLIIGGIYFELQTPGIGFPLAASVTAAILYFAPLYIEGLAEHWEVLIFIVGLVLVAIEVFALPGFGVAGISGIILIILSLALSMVGNVGFNFEGIPSEKIAIPFFIVIIASFASLVSSFYIGKKLFTTTRFGKLALDTVQDTNAGFTSGDDKLKHFLGKEGVAVTMLRPAGTIEIENEHYDAVAQVSFIEKGEKVVVVKYEHMQLVVKKI
ncbi:MAG: NfeD family protein [Bacteroidales bacterium]|nr:NfeD family protein [Bacteroidales bacterium]